MKILMMGDVVGKPGRRAVQKFVPGLRREHQVDLVIANAENSAAGSGITPDTAHELFEAEVDVLTSGNHAWAKREIIPFMDGDMPLIRPLNYPPGTPGKGYLLRDGVLVINVIGRVFMADVDCPFRAMDAVLERTKGEAKIVIVDCHAEATSEHNAIGWYLDGRVSAVLGTHTHIPTCDHRILPKGTAFITDIGMCGPRDSIIGNDPKEVLERFLMATHPRLNVATGPVRFSSVLVDIDDGSGKARSITRIDRELET